MSFRHKFRRFFFWLLNPDFPRSRINDDVHVLRARARARLDYWRIEVIGISGIGKSYFSRHLARVLGIRWRTAKSSPSNPGGAFEASRRSFLHQGVLGRLDALEGSSRGAQGLRRFTGIFERERAYDEGYSGQPIMMASGTVQSSQGILAKAIADQPLRVMDFMKNRLVIVCTAENVGSRAASGLVQRGKFGVDTLTEDNFAKRHAGDVGVRGFGEQLVQLGVPVLVLDLGESLRSNTARVAFFLDRHGVESRRIPRWARRHQQALV